RLFAARDRFGEKPLYYARLADRLLLASELKALLVHPDVSRELDWDALARYLTHEYVPAPHAIFRAVRKLLPAHYMMAGPDGSQTIRRYWTPPRRALAAPTAAEAADGVLTRLRASVARRVACDVPWGCFLSGDGGDELFCGYPTQTAHVAAEAFRRLPAPLRRGVARAADRLPPSHAYLSFDFALRRFLRDAERPAPERHLRWMAGFSPED